MRLSDGSSWPDLERAGEAEWALRHARSLGDAPTRGDELVAASVIGAYRHLLTHPAGTEAAVRKLRELRRRCK